MRASFFREQQRYRLQLYIIKVYDRSFIAAHVPRAVKAVVSPFFGSGGVEFELVHTRKNLRVRGSDGDAALVSLYPLIDPIIIWLLGTITVPGHIIIVPRGPINWVKEVLGLSGSPC